MNITNKSYIILISLSLLCLCGCSKEKSEIPTYLKLLPAQVEVSNNQGTSRQNIEDYWVYVGNELLGVFYPNQSIPVIGDELEEISILPGVRTNGIRDNAGVYPFLENYRTQVDLCACADTVIIQPVFKYKPTAKFSFTEDFENNNIFTEDLDSDPSTSITIQSTTVYEGAFSLALNVNKDHAQNVATSQLYFSDFASDGRDIFLEFNYKSDFNFAVGLDINLPGSDPVYPFGIFESDEWKKMYINLKDIVKESGSTSGYRIVFNVIHPGGSSEPGFLYLDNIKLVHY